MKKLTYIICLVAIVVCAVFVGIHMKTHNNSVQNYTERAMQFVPKLDLLKHYDEVKYDDSHNPPYVAIYRRGNKTLVYMADLHAKETSWNMVDWCFSKKFKYKPEVLLTEFENAGRKLTHSPNNTLSHAAFVAAEHGVPVVLADLSDTEMMSIIGTNDKEYLSDVLLAGPNRYGNDLEKLSDKINIDGRNKFMIQNIAAALNKYDTVFCIFGEGHLREQSTVLADMLGEPEYITDFPDMHTDFGKDIVSNKQNLFERARDKFLRRVHNIEVIRLVEFEKE